jgi:hypothetical protein
MNALYSRSQADAEAEVVELQRQIELDRNVEASLRTELAELRANEARWSARMKALEARLEHISNIAGGRAVVDEGSAEE